MRRLPVRPWLLVLLLLAMLVGLPIACGYLHLPGGQAGHPLSPFYRAGFDDWALGRPRPLLPGPVAHTLTLQAAREGTP